MAYLREKARKRRHRRIRKKIVGTAVRPRLCVTKSLKHITAQIINDQTGQTLLGLATYSKEVKGKAKGGNRAGAKILGRLIAEKAKQKKIESVVFDRGGYIFHGRIRELAEAAREGGLKF